MTAHARLVSALALAVLSLAAGPAGAQNTRGLTPHTASGEAYVEVTRAARRDQIMTVVLTFRTDLPGYRGETIYADIPGNEVVRRVYLLAGDRDFPVLNEGGELFMPEALHLEANESGEAGAVVGQWEAVFIAPDHDLREVTLYLPNVDPIGPFPIRNR
jgi:hypothetical protein